MGFQQRLGASAERSSGAGLGCCTGQASRPQVYKPAMRAYCPDTQKARSLMAPTPGLPRTLKTVTVPKSRPATPTSWLDSVS